MIRSQCVKCGEEFFELNKYYPAESDMNCPKCQAPPRDGDRNIHTMPDSGPEHPTSKDCWCHPVLNYKDLITGVEHWVHNDTRKDALQ